MKKLGLSFVLTICLWRSAFSERNISATPAPPLTSVSSISTSLNAYSSSPTTATPTTRNGTTTSTTVAPTSGPAHDTCVQRNSSCGECVKDVKCYWCGADNMCKRYPAITKVIPRDCESNKWYWKQCLASGNILIYMIASVSFVVLVTLGCCVYCLCCHNRRQRSYDKEDRKLQRRRDEIQQRHAERRAERKMRTDAIRQKYGLLSNEDDAEVA